MRKSARNPNSEPEFGPPSRPYTRVVRRAGRAVRDYTPAGPLADALHADAERARLADAALQQSLRDLDDEFRPVVIPLKAYLRAVQARYSAFMQTIGYHRPRRTWRKRRMSVEQYHRLVHQNARTAGHDDHVGVTDLGQTAREAWFRLVVDATGAPAAPAPPPSGDSAPPVDARLQTEAALREEWELQRAAWSEPDDPPVLRLMVDALVTVWLQREYLVLRAAAVAAHGPPEMLARYRAMADDASRLITRFLRNLEEARIRRTEWEMRKLRLEELQREVRRTRKNPNRRPRRKPVEGDPLLDPKKNEQAYEEVMAWLRDRDSAFAAETTGEPIDRDANASRSSPDSDPAAVETQPEPRARE